MKYSGRTLFLALLFLFSHGPLAFSATWYIATNGSDLSDGSSNTPFATITRAQTAASSNDIVYIRGGTYYLDNTHITSTNSPWVVVNTITKSGITYIAFPGERPVFDFSAVQPTGWRVTAFRVTANACVFQGFDVVGVQVVIHAGEANNTQSECFRVSGSRNRFEQLAMHDGMGIGWYLTGGSSNLVLNCDAYNNRGLDSLSMGNVDGFGCHPSNNGGSGNVIRGCRAWFNSDDGFDCINAWFVVTFENCWAFYNGYFTNFTSTGGDANGFKSGGYGLSGTFPPTAPRHVTRFCLAVKNRANGFYANHHTGGLDWFNNTAYRNNVNYNMLCNLNAQSGNDVPGFDHMMKNNLGYRGNAETNNLGPTNDVSFNYFTLPVTVASNDFMILNETLLTSPRQTNGDLPYIAFAQLVGASDLVDAGTNCGFAFVGDAPDLGAFEYGSHSPPALAIARDGANLVFSGSGGPAGGTNYLVATTNLALPIVQWTPIATNAFDLAGAVSITNTSPNTDQLFHRLRIQ